MFRSNLKNQIQIQNLLFFHCSSALEAQPKQDLFNHLLIRLFNLKWIFDTVHELILIRIFYSFLLFFRILCLKSIGSQDQYPNRTKQNQIVFIFLILDRFHHVNQYGIKFGDAHLKSIDNIQSLVRLWHWNRKVKIATDFKMVIGF